MSFIARPCISQEKSSGASFADRMSPRRASLEKRALIYSLGQPVDEQILPLYEILRPRLKAISVSRQGKTGSVIENYMRGLKSSI